MISSGEVMQIQHEANEFVASDAARIYKARIGAEIVRVQDTADGYKGRSNFWGLRAPSAVELMRYHSGGGYFSPELKIAGRGYDFTFEVGRGLVVAVIKEFGVGDEPEVIDNGAPEYSGYKEMYKLPSGLAVVTSQVYYHGNPYEYGPVAERWVVGRDRDAALTAIK